jgi:AcrR family transcriptional regulator
VIALRMSTDRGFDTTTIEQIATEAGVSERTFFRYFTTKASVLWSEFETEVETIRSTLAAVPDDLPMMDAIRRAVVAANHYRAEDVPEMGMRMNLIATVPALSFSAAEHYESREEAISEFAARRLGRRWSCHPRRVPGGLRPLVGPGGHRPDRLPGRGVAGARGRLQLTAPAGCLIRRRDSVSAQC